MHRARRWPATVSERARGCTPNEGEMLRRPVGRRRMPDLRCDCCQRTGRGEQGHAADSPATAASCLRRFGSVSGNVVLPGAAREWTKWSPSRTNKRQGEQPQRHRAEDDIQIVWVPCNCDHGKPDGTPNHARSTASPQSTREAIRRARPSRPLPGSPRRPRASREVAVSFLSAARSQMARARRGT